MNTTQLASLINTTFARMHELSATKGEEYTGGGEANRLQNFLSAGERLGLNPLVPLFIAMDKHFNSFTTYVKERQAGKERAVAEPIEERLDDLILYAILAKGLLRELDGKNDPPPERDGRGCEDEGCPHYDSPHVHVDPVANAEVLRAIFHYDDFAPKYDNVVIAEPVEKIESAPLPVNNWHYRVQPGQYPPGTMFTETTDAQQGVHYSEVVHDEPTRGVRGGFVRGDSLISGRCWSSPYSVRDQLAEYNRHKTGDIGLREGDHVQFTVVNGKLAFTITRDDAPLLRLERAQDDGPNYEAEQETDEDHGVYVNSIGPSISDEREQMIQDHLPTIIEPEPEPRIIDPSQDLVDFLAVTAPVVAAEPVVLHGLYYTPEEVAMVLQVDKAVIRSKMIQLGYLYSGYLPNASVLKIAQELGINAVGAVGVPNLSPREIEQRVKQEKVEDTIATLHEPNAVPVAIAPLPEQIVDPRTLLSAAHPHHWLLDDGVPLIQIAHQNYTYATLAQLLGITNIEIYRVLKKHLGEAVDVLTHISPQEALLVATESGIPAELAPKDGLPTLLDDEPTAAQCEAVMDLLDEACMNDEGRRVSWHNYTREDRLVVIQKMLSGLSTAVPQIDDVLNVLAHKYAARGRLVITGPDLISRNESGFEPPLAGIMELKANSTATFEAVQLAVVDWAYEVFPKRSIDTVRLKLIQEGNELVTALSLNKWDNIEDEIADVQILLMDLAVLQGFHIPTVTQRKLDINRTRSWTIDPDGLSHHV